MSQSSTIISSTTASHERQLHGQVVFENVADQYVKGEDISVQFSILNDLQVNPTEDQVGLIRVGAINTHECLAYAAVQLDSSSRHGTATFASSVLPATDDEFYQFCYVVNQRKSLGSSIPFQLNCSMDDIDLLASALTEKTIVQGKSDDLIALADRDNDDLVVVHTKRMIIEEKLRQENRQLLENNRRLEQKNEECKAKLQLLDFKSNEYINKVKSDLQVLATSHRVTIEELASRQRLEAKLRAEYDACLSLSAQCQNESLQFAERCRTLEAANTKLTNETNQMGSRLSVATKFTEEQALLIADFEKRLIQSKESFESASQHQLKLEQQLRDLTSTTEKYQLTMQEQLDAYTKQASQQENQIHALKSVNGLLKEELSTVKSDNKVLMTMALQDKQLTKDFQQEVNDLNEQHRRQNEQQQRELESLREELARAKEERDDCVSLKTSFNTIEKRCLKHQKNEIDVKKQLTVYKEFMADLERKVQELTDRLLVGAEEYKSLYRKYAALERMIVNANRPALSMPKSNPTTLSNETGLNEEALVTLLRNSYELQQQDQLAEPEPKEEGEKKMAADDNEEIRECPMCYWEFPRHLSLESKKQHIDNHFT